MPFQIRYNENHSAGLVAICDACGKQITDAEAGNILWDMPPDAKPGGLFAYKLSHKAPCSLRFQGVQCWTPLDVAIAGHLVNNTGINIEKARDTMERLDRIG